MKHVVTFSSNRPREASAEFRVGVRSVPYLADHGFQDMVVLPGSFYIEMALCLEREAFKRETNVVRKVIFENPIILSAEDTVIKVEANECEDGRVTYAFYEAGVDSGSDDRIARKCAARLAIDRSASASPGMPSDAFAIEVFQAQSDSVIDAKQFYGTLRQNGNQYGPRFRNVSTIWRMGDQSLGQISATREHDKSEPHVLHPCLLDAVTQLLAPFVAGKGKTFILRAIEKVEVADLNFPDTLWGHATLQRGGAGEQEGLVGNVRVFDQRGRQYLELSGVAFTLLDLVGGVDERATANLVIAANFTAEPLEDALEFWGDHFDVRIHTEFAPYNQVFQQLLDAGSAFRKNSDGVNVVLLGLEEWTSGNRHPPMELSKERAAKCFGARPRCVLPNGLQIVHLNQYETDYVFNEIFEDQCYLKHGIRLEDGDTVIDIGANIGLFSLFVMSRCKDARIYACEPAPMVYDLLRANCDAYGSNVRTLNIGVSDQRKTALFTFYEKSSVFSGFHSDETEDREAIQAVVRNMLNRESIAGDSVDEYVSELTADRLRQSVHECQLMSISDMIRENRIDKIDLLKIDAEKSELDIIKGIEDGDWPKIKQIVLEIHDPTRETIEQIERLLIDRGYRCAVEQESLLEHAGLFNLYATRAEAGEEAGADPVTTRARSGQARHAANNLQRNIEEFGGALRSFMSQSKVPLILCSCPRSPAAEVDAGLKAALDEAEDVLLSAAGQIANVRTIGSALPLQHYPVTDYYDQHTHRAGHIPYTPECYAAIGTALVRTIYGMKSNPYKVIVLDCDNTLWKGVCGEDGPLGVEVTAPYRALQEFMIAQMNAGMLLCLCSKNNEKDALEVFARRSDMPLKREHLVACRLNWNSKSENIRSLAKELNLGLDSFIFVDDNPVECADVRINCPGVLALQLPRRAESIPAFLNHVWAFDHRASTGEDRDRTRMYQESTRRERYREQSFSLRDFIKGLELRVEIAEATEEQLSRVSQLTFRTNQFNFTTIRRSEEEIRAFLNRERGRCLAVRVADRFGDYGLVGALMYEIEAERYKVDTFLLSCRVLGRGVEHALVSRLGQMAVAEGKSFVEFAYLETAKNLPALEFITRIGDQYRNDTGTSWSIPADRLASVAYDPDQPAPIQSEEEAAVDKAKPALRQRSAFDAADRPERLQRIGEELFDIERLATAIEKFRFGQQPLPARADATPGSSLEATLANIWRKVLGKPRIGVNENFFEVGGTSLKAVQVIAAIKKELNQSLSIVSLFECPTVALLAAKLNAATEETPAATATAAAAQRGQQRRYNTLRPRAS